MKNIIKKANIPGVKLSKKPLSLTFPSTGYGGISKNNCKVNINWLTLHCCLIWFIYRVFYTREKTFVNKIFVIYDLICKNLPRKNKEHAIMKNVMNVMKNSSIFKENMQKMETICKGLVCKTVFLG